jgi:hypothetical protein
VPRAVNTLLPRTRAVLDTLELGDDKDDDEGTFTVLVVVYVTWGRPIIPTQLPHALIITVSVPLSA